MAAQNAIANPLLDETSLKGAKAVLVNITGGMDMTLLEVDEAANAISAEVDADANIIFGAAFDPALDGKIRVSVVATGMDEAVKQTIEPTGARGGLGLGRSQPVQPPRMEAPRVEPRPEPIIRPAEPRREPIVPTFAAAPAPQPAPVARQEAPRELEPIVDPWVEEYEARPAVAQAAPTPAAVAQGDLYMDAPAPQARPEPQPEPQVRDEDDWDDRDHHRKSGWSLFGKKRAQPQTSSYGAPTRTTSQYADAPTRGATAMQPAYEPEPESDDDLQIPSFLRRLAN
jgi:cell division protein FtsZ